MPWRFDNLTTQLGRRAVFGLSAFAQTFPHIRHVFFQGRNADGSGDGHIHEFYWDGIDTTTGWHHNDLTNNTHAPLAADIGFPSSYMFKGSGTQHVIYQGLGDAGRINELWWDGDWHHNDLTSAAGNAPLTSAHPSATSIPSSIPLASATSFPSVSSITLAITGCTFFTGLALIGTGIICLCRAYLALDLGPRPMYFQCRARQSKARRASAFYTCRETLGWKTSCTFTSLRGTNRV